MNEHHFTALLERATGELAPDVERLVAAGSARGRTRLRRRRIGSTVAAVAAVAAITIGTTALVDGGEGTSRTEPDFADNGTSAQTGPTERAGPPRKQPRAPDRPITVAAEDVPEVVGSFLPPGTISEPLTGGSFPLVDTADERIVHFRYDGTLTTFVISRADTLAGCQRLANANAANESAPAPTCTVRDGFEVLIADDTYLTVRTTDVWVWNHGWVVQVLSYNVADAKNPDGSEDPPPLMDQPAISEDELFAIASSEVWFE